MMLVSPSGFACLLSWALVAAPAQVVSDPQAKRLVDQAKQAFSEGDYDEAAEKIEAAYLIEPAPALLYPWAQAERSRGDCRSAVELYQKFLESDPGESIAAAARENIERCEEQLALEPPEDEEEDEDIVDAVLSDPDPIFAPEEASEPTPAVDVVRPWYKDPVGGALLGVGLAGVGAGLGLYGGAASVAGRAADEDSHDAYADRRQRAGALRTGSIVVVSIGSALVVGAVIRYVTQARKAKTSQLAGWIGPDGAGLGWTGRF